MPETISFFSQGSRLAGRLWGSGQGRAPALLVTGSWMTVKEQMPANYAPLLADAGYVVLTFDFRGFGESGGEPRDVESARGKAEDIRNAVSWLRTHPSVDPDRIGAVAICASAGYVALAMTDEPQLRSVALVAPWLHDAGIVSEIYGGEDGVRTRMEQALAARERYARSGEVEYVPAASSSDSSAAMCMPGDALDYYLNPDRGAVPQWHNRFAVMAWKEWLAFDAIGIAPRVRAPVRIISSDGSATPAGARRFEAGLGGAHDSIWMEGTQFDFYDDGDTVAEAAKHAVAHLRATL